MGMAVLVFYTFMVFMVLILLNLFIAIVSDAFAAAKEETAEGAAAHISLSWNITRRIRFTQTILQLTKQKTRTISLEQLKTDFPKMAADEKLWACLTDAFFLPSTVAPTGKTLSEV